MVGDVARPVRSPPPEQETHPRRDHVAVTRAPNGWALAMTCATVVATLGACRSGSQTTEGRPDDDPAVVVASFNFRESELLAEIYAQAIEQAGIPVRRELNLGPRELVQPAVAQGLVDVVPEYLGSALRNFGGDPPMDATDAEEVRDLLSRSWAPWDVHVLTPAAAQNQNALVMLRARAGELGVERTTGLRRHPDLVLGGPPECSTRDLCLRGLQQVYGLEFSRFVPFTSLAQEQTALLQGLIDVAVMFTTDGRLADPTFIVLDDDLGLQPAENVVPIVTGRALERYGSRLTSVLDHVSEQLTSSGLTFLNWRVEIDGKSISGEAAGWLARHP
jgi:osmoprotectant transport system substrate-binding protein